MGSMTAAIRALLIAVGLFLVMPSVYQVLAALMPVVFALLALLIVARVFQTWLRKW